MADIAASNWNEADASNSTAAPDGAPEGMAPSGVNDTMRAMMGATKRWYDWNIPKITGGTSTAYTLSYTVAPGALVDGMTHLVQFNAANGASPTLNVNALGAKPLHFYLNGSWAVLPANTLNVDQVVRVTYNAAVGTYRCIGAAIPSGDFCVSGGVLLGGSAVVMTPASAISGNSGTWYNSGTGRYTPPPGRYRISTAFAGQSTVASTLTIEIRKNGASTGGGVASATIASSGFNGMVQQDLTFDANGTDYFEVFASANGGSNGTVWFSAFQINA